MLHFAQHDIKNENGIALNMERTRSSLKKSIFAKLKADTLSAANFRASANGRAGDSNDY